MSDQHPGPDQNPNRPPEQQPDSDVVSLEMPESPADLGQLSRAEQEMIIAARQQQANPEQVTEPRPSRRGILKGLFATGAVVAGGGGIYAATRGKGGAQATPSPQTQNSTPAPSPTASNTPSAQPSTSEVVNPAEAEAAAIQKMWSSAEPVYRYNGRPRHERLGVVAAVNYQIMNGGYSKFFGRDDQMIDGKRLFEFNPLDPNNGASELNNGQEILDQMLFAEQAVMAQYIGAEKPSSSGDPGDPMDTEHSLKMISGLSYYTDRDNHPELTNDTYSEAAHFYSEEEITGVFKAPSRYISDDYSDRIMTGKDLEGNTIKYKDVVYRKAGKTYTDRFVLDSVSVNVKDVYSGKIIPVDMNIWLKYSSIRKRILQ